MWLHHVLALGVVFSSATATESSCNPKSCSKDVDNERNVCGTDGLTYPSRCHLEKSRCITKNLTLAKRGPCRQQKACRDWEIYRHSNPDYKFKATCRPDGTYTAPQCYPDIGFCWCVTPQGLPLPFTSTPWKQDIKVHCGHKKKSNRRRSPPRKGRNRPCRQPDKAKFNNNLINIFHTEWSRQHGENLRPHNNESDLMVKQWKFRAMDGNGDGVLDRSEYRDLKKVTKNAVKPKKCAKMFPKSCDVNSDTMISQQEWVECLTRDGMDDGGGRGGGQQPEPEDTRDVEEDFSDTYASHRMPPHTLIDHYDEDSTETREGEEDATDCISDRNTALRDGGQFYVPECTPDGRYEKIQCYKSAGYCFCVNEDNGKNIPGTTVQHGTPKCDQVNYVNRLMKGCSHDKKLVFLRDLMHFLHARMLRDNDTKTLNNIPWMPTKEEKAANWNFVDFDKNKNKFLDRNEWKLFKEVVSSEKILKKCGKKLPRYCDINKDRRISKTEWLGCLNIHAAVETSTTGTISVRTGKKNPLDVLLED